MPSRQVVCCIALSLGVCSGATAECSSAAPEGVDSFLERFMGSKSFATSRTLYPYVQIVETEEGEEKEVVTKSRDAKFPPLAEFIHRNQMAFGIEDRKATRATLRVYAPNTGYSIRYRFISKQGCWFLKSTSIVSM